MARTAGNSRIESNLFLIFNFFFGQWITVNLLPYEACTVLLLLVLQYCSSRLRAITATVVYICCSYCLVVVPPRRRRREQQKQGKGGARGGQERKVLFERPSIKGGRSLTS
ncbi:hypothetical protein V8C42DRAFT_330099 [Trichoderma barbatum]